MKHRWEGDTLFFSGVLNEQMSEDSLVKMFSEAQARQTHQKTELSLDFADVVRANSLGLKNWICALERIPIQGWYVRIPPWFVLQLNTIDELSIGGALLVRSFYAPFCHAETGDVTNILVRVGEDLPIKSRYDTTDLMAVVGNDEMLQPDFEEEEYLRFIASFYDRYADIFRPRT